MLVVTIFLVSECQRMKYSNFGKILRLFQTSTLLHKNVFFLHFFTMLINIALYILQGVI